MIMRLSESEDITRAIDLSKSDTSCLTGGSGIVDLSDSEDGDITNVFDAEMYKQLGIEPPKTIADGDFEGVAESARVINKDGQSYLVYTSLKPFTEDGSGNGSSGGGNGGSNTPNNTPSNNDKNDKKVDERKAEIFNNIMMMTKKIGLFKKKIKFSQEEENKLKAEAEKIAKTENRAEQNSDDIKATKEKVEKIKKKIEETQKQTEEYKKETKNTIKKLTDDMNKHKDAILDISDKSKTATVVATLSALGLGSLAAYILLGQRKKLKELEKKEKEREEREKLEKYANGGYDRYR